VVKGPQPATFTSSTSTKPAGSRRRADLLDRYFVAFPEAARGFHRSREEAAAGQSRRFPPRRPVSLVNSGLRTEEAKTLTEEEITARSSGR